MKLNGLSSVFLEEADLEVLSGTESLTLAPNTLHKLLAQVLGDKFSNAK